MNEVLVRVQTRPLSGNESLVSGGKSLGLSVLDFWRWSTSDLVNNSTRGVLAEFIVAYALGISFESVRDPWRAYDLITPEGITVEVKSAAYVQSWYQRRLSTIVFNTPKTRAWDADSNLQEKTSKRQAQVYVFALFAHQDKKTINPLDLDQWLFYVLPTKVIDERVRSQHSITLTSLEKLAGSGCRITEVREKTINAAKY